MQQLQLLVPRCDVIYGISFQSASGFNTTAVLRHKKSQNVHLQKKRKLLDIESRKSLDVLIDCHVII